MKIKIEKCIKKYLMFFMILTVSAASFCGFFSVWTFRDGDLAFGFQAMIEETGERPFVHRQLLPQTVKYIASAIPQPAKGELEAKIIEGHYIENRYTQAEIPNKYVIEYYLMYIFCFLALFFAAWVLRSLLSEIVQDKVVGTLGAMVFILIWPFFEVLGGYYYDIFEFLFMFMAARFALHGKWVGLLLLTPIAEANKEAFLFFLITLYPLVRMHYSWKKAALVTLEAVFLAGITYLYIRSIYAGNPGDMADWRIRDHMYTIFDFTGYFNTTTIYGLPLGEGMFLPHMICVAYIVKKSWHNLTDAWKEHVKLASIINGVLYFMFVLPNEIRDLSMLYVSLMVLVTFFIRDLILKNYQKDTLK